MFEVNASYDVALDRAGQYFTCGVVVPGDLMTDPMRDGMTTVDCGSWETVEGACLRQQNTPNEQTVNLRVTSPFDPAALGGGNDLHVRVFGLISVGATPELVQEIDCH